MEHTAISRRTLLALASSTAWLAAPASAAVTLKDAIGVTTAGDVFSPLIPAGRSLPLTFSQTFGNRTQGGDAVEVKLSQKRSTGMETIAVLRIAIPRAADNSLNITVTLTISADKQMRVKTTVAETASVQTFGPFPVQ